MIKFVHIVARSVNGVIGNDGDIPWKISKDLTYFKELTTNNICIVGRKTYDGIKHLKNRIFIVITSSKDYADIDGNSYFVNSLDEAISKSKEMYIPSLMSNVYIIGGAEIYKMSFEYVDTLYVTEIERAIDGDAYYFIPDAFKLMESSELHSENKIPFYFAKYKRA